MTTPQAPLAGIEQRIRDKEAQLAALQQELQQLYRQAGRAPAVPHTEVHRSPASPLSI